MSPNQPSPSSTAPTSRREFIKTTLGGTLLAAGAVHPPVRAAAPALPATFPLFHARGTPRELGRLHGEQAAGFIGAHLDYLRTTMRIGREELETRARRFRPLFTEHCPHLLEEINGLAEGARISEAEALAVNLRGVLGRTAGDGCTAFAIDPQGTADGGILIGQNSDMLPIVTTFGYVLHLQPRDRPEILMWTFGGMIGYHGLNRHGVAHFANDLGGGPGTRFALPHYPLKRLMLECRTLEEIEALFHRYPLWANGNYVVCDGLGRILDIEATTAGPEMIRDAGAGFLVHSNHFLSPRYATAENHARSAPDSIPRQQRMERLIAGRFGRTTLADVQRYLRKSERAVGGICRLAQTTDPAADWVTAGITVASLIADPSQGRLHVAAGNDPANPWVAYPFN